MNQQELYREIERRLRKKVDRELDQFIRGMVDDDVYAPDVDEVDEIAAADKIMQRGPPYTMEDLVLLQRGRNVYMRNYLDAVADAAKDVAGTQPVDPEPEPGCDGPEDGILSAGAVRAAIKTLRDHGDRRADLQADRIAQLEQVCSGEGTKLCALEIMADMDDSVQDAVAGFKDRIARLEAWRADMGDGVLENVRAQVLELSEWVIKYDPIGRLDALEAWRDEWR